MTTPYFIGIDIGTQGARVILMDAVGNIVGSREETFALDDHSREEQSPDMWWDVCMRSLQSLILEARHSIPLHEVKAISVTSTSGTVIPLDAQMLPLHNAIMYSDKRSAAEGKFCRDMALRFHSSGYTGFNSSSGLSKMLWFSRQFPEKAPGIVKWIHASDFISGKLSGIWGITDYTNALKSGFDVRNGHWPSYLYEKLPIKREWLPTVVPPGTPVGNLSPPVATALGLPSTVRVVAGMTDGCASQIASGAVQLGDWNTTIGTTLVIKGVTRKEIKDPGDRIYSHRHPEGFWMPGGASNTGADWVTREFSENLAGLNEQAGQLIPTGQLAYPLRQDGERFPFIAPQARGFAPKGLTHAELFAANMEGVAYLERYAYQLIETLSGEKVMAVFTAGGGSKSDAWLTIRSNILNLPIYKMKHVSGAVGAAILAASKTHFSSVIEATKAMTQIEKEIQPDKKLSESYHGFYGKFVALLAEKGYIKKEKSHA